MDLFILHSPTALLSRFRSYVRFQPFRLAFVHRLLNLNHQLSVQLSIELVVTGDYSPFRMCTRSAGPPIVRPRNAFDIAAYLYVFALWFLFNILAPHGQFTEGHDRGDADDGISLQLFDCCYGDPWDTSSDVLPITFSSPFLYDSSPAPCPFLFIFDVAFSLAINSLCTSTLKWGRGVTGSLVKLWGFETRFLRGYLLWVMSIYAQAAFQVYVTDVHW